MNPDTCPNYYVGYRIITNINMVVPDGTITIYYTWKQRLLRWPWRPWIKSFEQIKYKPSDGVIFDEIHKIMYIHPETENRLKNAIEHHKHQEYP